MISNEKEAHRMAMVRADGLDSDQNALAEPPQLDAPPCSNAETTNKRSRLGCQFCHSNYGTDNVTLILPGPNCQRARIGGSKKSKAALLQQIFAFLETSTSLNSIIRTTEAAAISVRALYETRQGHSRRLACPEGTKGKPVNVLGHIDPRTLIKGVT
jgi:hypothetical protein